jgi:hypothetical protein
LNERARRHSPAAERNRQAIVVELQRRLPAHGLALEVASGSGQHVAHFAAAMPAWRWQPSDGDDDARASINAWCEGLANVSPAITLDVLAAVWPGVPDSVDAVYCANLLHIAPWPVCAALMQGAARQLAAAGLLLVYGPFVVDDEPVAPSNQAFDTDLRQRNVHWGLRRLGDVQDQAHRAGLALRERIDMPANNLLLVFVRD